MSDKPLKIEELLGKIDGDEIPDDVVHRYELRRTLLCSRYFNADCERDEKRNRFLAYTVPLFAGTMLVVVFAVAGTSILDISVSSEPHPTIDTSHLISADRLSEITFIAAKEPSRVNVAEFVDTQNPPVPLEDVLRFVPVSLSSALLVQ